MKVFLKTIIDKPFVRNVTTVASGMTIAQVVVIGFSPIITRLYGPEAFGAFEVFASIAAVVMPIASLTYGTAIVLPKSDDEALGLAGLSMVLSLLLAFLTALVLTAFKTQIIKSLDLKQIAPYLMVIPFVLVFSALTNVLYQWTIRKSLYKTNAKATIAQALVINTTKSGIGVFIPTAGVLIIVSAIGHLVYAILLGLGLKKSQRRAFISGIKIKNLKYYLSIAKKYRDFPIFRMPQSLIVAIAEAAPVILLTSLFGPAAAGFYGLGQKILKRPSKIIGKSIGNVYYPKIAKAANAGKRVDKYIKKTTLAVGALILLPFALIFTFGPSLFSVIFGSKWLMAGEYARWFCILVFFDLILFPSKDAIIVLGLQSKLFIFEISTLVCKLTALYVGFFCFNNDVAAIVMFCLTGAVLNIILFIWTYSKAVEK